MDLQTLILEVLSGNVTLKASEIAKTIKQKYNIEADKSEINSLLYGKLKGKVKQDNNYRWSRQNHESIFFHQLSHENF